MNGHFALSFRCPYERGSTVWNMGAYRITRQAFWLWLKSPSQWFRVIHEERCFMVSSLWATPRKEPCDRNLWLLTLRRASACRVSASRIKTWIITFVNRERVTAWQICNRDLQNFDNYTLNTWLKYSEIIPCICLFFDQSYQRSCHFWFARVQRKFYSLWKCLLKVRSLNLCF